MQDTAQKTLAGQVAVVTGGGAGIGSALSTTIASMGALVAICGRRRKPLEHTAEVIRRDHGKAEIVECDVTDLRSVERMAAQVSERFGRADILINNAGVGSFSSPLHELPPDQWDNVLNTNLRGAYYCIRAFAPMMIRARSGHIINISSIASKNALRNGAAYAASKWGLNGLSYSVAEELREYGIRVSVVCPGSTNSDLSPHTGKNPNKMLTPNDIAHVVAMLVMQAPQSFTSEVVIRPTMKP
ncbi:MAG TPA: SDR family NAD(P)-dependent oxidoreductase [Terriglobales bacterium]|nr:SDR family NAD(P)-dependent oxidoreductase [Terriglobales bacterium]